MMAQIVLCIRGYFASLRMKTPPLVQNSELIKDSSSETETFANDQIEEDRMKTAVEIKYNIYRALSKVRFT